MPPITYEDPLKKLYNPFGTPKVEFWEHEIIKGVFVRMKLAPRRPDDVIVLNNGRIIMPNLNIY